MKTRLSVAGVSERDVDLLLLEEFQSSPDFGDWFVLKALGPSKRLGQLVEARRSVTQSTGESDLEVAFSSEKKRICRLMIENKVGAGFQPLQAARYRVRGDSYVAEGRCSAYYTVIVAPARYFGDSGDNRGFDGRVTYEQVLKWFLDDHSLGERRHYKIALLQSAIDKATLGYQPEEDAPNTDFWRAYWQYARERAPRLEMKEPLAKPSGAGFIYFRPPSLPRGVEICHKFNRGFVDLQINGMGDRLNEVNEVLGPRFESRMRLKQAAKSAAIRIEVPVLRAGVTIAAQEQHVNAGLDAAMSLLVWFEGVKDVWLSHAANSPVGAPRPSPVSTRHRASK